MKTEQQRLHAGEKVQIGNYWVVRCSRCLVTRCVTEFKRDSRTKSGTVRVCNICKPPAQMRFDV